MNLIISLRVNELMTLFTIELMCFVQDLSITKSVLIYLDILLIT
jgi:hypothetical protein